MLDVILKNWESEYIPETAAETEITTEPDTELTTEQPTRPAEITEPENPTEPAGHDDPGVPEPPTAPVTEPDTEEPTPENPGTPGIFAAEMGVADILSVFPDAPEKFHEIPFPNSVLMTDSLKNNMTNLAGFSPRDFGGTDFYIATTDARLFTPLYNGGMLSDARRYRTQIVDAECNIETVSLEKPRENIFQDIRLSIQSDEFFSDIICVPFDIQSELIRHGFIMNMRKVPFLNLSAEYFNASATDAYSVNGNVYGVVSDFTFDPSAVYAMYYNRDIIERHNLTNPADLHKEGKWDFDAMFAISKEYSPLIDLAGIYTIEFEQENTDLFNGLFIASGNRYFTPRNNSFPILNFNSERTVNLINAISKIFQPDIETGMANFIYTTPEPERPHRFFREGSALFTVAKLDMIPEITNSRFDWGLLPVPVMDANSARYSFTDNNAMSISVLRSARNTEACGIVISALSLASHRQLKDIYVLEQMLYTLRDVDSVNILGEIVHNTAFSQYNAYPTIPEIYNATAGILKNAANTPGNFFDLYENNRRALNDFFRTADIFQRR